MREFLHVDDLSKAVLFRFRITWKSICIMSEQVLI